jgi:hypothetical protein
MSKGGRSEPPAKARDIAQMSVCLTIVVANGSRTVDCAVKWREWEIAATNEKGNNNGEGLSSAVLARI